jgi:DNA-binding transcriptional MerR regulator
MSDVDQPMMQIGELAERAEMSLRTIRHYDEVGLLAPTGRTEGGFRLYTEADFQRLLVIRRMKPLGFSLDEMAELLRVVADLESATAAGPEGGAEGSPEHVAAVRARLDSFIEQTVERRARLERQLGMADEFLELLHSR